MEHKIMKNFTIITIITLSVALFAGISVFAQNLNPSITNDSEVDIFENEDVLGHFAVVADDFEFPPDRALSLPTTDGLVADDFVVPPNKALDKRIANEGNKDAIADDFEVSPNKALGAPTTDGVVADDFEFSPNKDTPQNREAEVIQSIFDIGVEESVEFNLANNRIIVSDERIIDYKEIVRESEVMPPIEIEINSAITDGKVFDLKVIPRPESAEFKFIYRGKEAMMPIYSDFKVENKKLYLLENDKSYNLRINPCEIYSAVYDSKNKEPKIIIKELSLGIENGKAVYDLRVEQPAKILWIIPWTVKSRYLIDPTDGSAELVDSPWYITSEKLEWIDY